jgi:hypothetical protein
MYLPNHKESDTGIVRQFALVARPFQSNHLWRIQVINATPSKSSVVSEAISQNTSHGVL